ncbi:MAG: integrase core domain-containing protein, partial [Anaerolineae bacterium]
IVETCAKQGIEKDQLILHSDRGSAMRSKTVTDLLGDLGVVKSHSRPHTPTDNPYSESQFKTMKYQPDYADKFDGVIHARGWARRFFRWYNQEHRHTGLGLMTAGMVHYGQAESVQEQRQQVLDEAYTDHPERFVGGRPRPPSLPKEVWINQPKKAHDDVPCSDGPAVRKREPGAQGGQGRTKRPWTPTSTRLPWSVRWFQSMKRAFSTLSASQSCGRVINTYRDDLAHGVGAQGESLAKVL